MRIRVQRMDRYEHQAGGARSEAVHQLLKAADDFVEELVHQLRLHHFGDVDDDALAAAGEVAGFGVGAATAGEEEHAGIGPLQGLQIGFELLFGKRMAETFGVPVEGPIRGVFIDVGPVEAGAAVGRVTEVVDFVAGGPEAGDHFGEIGVPPTGGDVDFCHNAGV